MVENQKVVTVTYDLLVTNENGTEELMEKATVERPLIYCHGENQMLPMFEAQLAGKNEGDSFDFVIPHDLAYGDYDEQGVLELDKKLFYNGDNEFDSQRVFVGNIVPMNTTDGQIINAQIVDIQEDKVTIDLNHPLAGEDLHFVGKIIAVRDATEEELEALHHGCGCCSGHCSDEGCGEHDCGEHGCGSHCYS